MKKRLFGIAVLILVLTGIIGYGIASSGLKLVGDAVTSPIEESQDLIVLNENQPQDALPIQPESSPSPEPTPEITPSPAESSGGVEVISLPLESASEPVSGSGGGGFGIESLSNEIGDQVIKPGVAPKSSVDYFTNIDEASDQKKCNLEEGVKKAYLNYDDVVGHGTSKDNSSSTITNVQTKLDDLAFVDGVCDDGNCGDKDYVEYWHTKTNKDLAEGWHTLWGRAKNARSNLEEFSVNNSCMFCIDKQDPSQPGKPAVVRKEVCDPLFASGEEVTFSWESGDNGNGCAGVSFFDVFVEINTSEGLEKREMTASGNSIEVEGVSHGNQVRVAVQPTDKAGNRGPVSEWSDWITIDNVKPKVEITTQTPNEWITGDFVVEENDSDENLLKCFYKVKNNGKWTTEGGNIYTLETDCNAPLLINVALYCPEDGDCEIFKRAQDKACNFNPTTKTEPPFKVDNHGPILEKIIGEPNYFDGKFLRTFTPITVTATDLGSGVNQTCYKFTNLQTGFTEEKCAEGEEVEFMFWDNESQHDLVFWATDMKGLRTEMNQTHFVDETPPVTAKTYSSIFQKLGEFMGISNFTMDWISKNTEITLNATDSDPHPSGVDTTLFRLFVLDEGDHTEWYGTKTGAWYDDEDVCEDANNAPEPAPSPIPPVNESNMSEMNQSQNESNNNESDNGGIGVAENGNCVAVSGWELAHDWAVYNEPISFGDHAEEDADHHALPHKICFKSIDNVENEEKQHCQVFFIDNAPPVITPLTLPNNQCQKSVTADIIDTESGVKQAWVEWIDENETSVLKKDMRFQEELVQLGLSKYQWDATFTPEELAMLNAGDYTVRITAEDGVGNRNTVDIEDQLKKVVCVLNIAPSQCIINSMTGGGCMFNFNVIVRGGNAVQMGMENLFGLSPQNLNATISNSFGSRAVGNDMLWNGGTLQINNTSGSNRGSFKLGMNIPASVTGTEVLDYFLRPQTV